MSQNPTITGNAFQYAGELCFPRLSGTRFEEPAQKTILKIFSALGLEPEIEEFPADYLMLDFSADAYGFLKAGYKAVSIGNINRFIHTSEDRIEHLVSANLDDYVQALSQLILKIDQGRGKEN